MPGGSRDVEHRGHTGVALCGSQAALIAHLAKYGDGGRRQGATRHGSRVLYEVGAIVNAVLYLLQEEEQNAA